MHRAPLAGFLFFLTGCDFTNTDTAVCDGGLESTTLSRTSDKDGAFSVPVPVTDADTAFMVLTERGSGTLSTDSVSAPDGTVALDWSDWSSSRESLTNAFYATPDVSVLNWPIRREDGALWPGDWEVTGSTLDAEGYPRGNQKVSVTVLTRRCGVGTPKLHVTLVYAGGLESDAEVSAAVEKAADRWVELYDAVGIELQVDFAAADTAGSLAEPLDGDEAYADIYGSIGEGVVVVVGDDVGGAGDLYGEAGGIPGAQIATTHSVVAVSWLVHAGADASFSKDEIELFAETMAHESGHFLGLYHPVEIGAEAWDALDDTKRCTSDAACETALAENLMFPYSVCDGARCIDQTELTADQAGILLNNVGVR